MGVMEHDSMALGLISAFLLVLLLAFLLVLAVIRWRRYKAVFQSAAEPVAAAPREPVPDTPGFALNRAHSWLAVKGTNAPAVLSALALHDPKPCSWAEGLLGDSEHRLFVSPPVAGWILVIGPALPDPADDVDASFRFISDLSRKLGHVQFFHIHAVLDHHAWVRAEAGKILRAYAWAGKTLWNQGSPTPAEMALGMKCLAYGESAELALFARSEAETGNSEKVPALAARWSLNPAEIDSRFLNREPGIAGEARRFF
jgi:cbb3-type cytochrome oxidase subunit 3